MILYQHYNFLFISLFRCSQLNSNISKKFILQSLKEMYLISNHVSQKKENIDHNYNSIENDGKNNNSSRKKNKIRITSLTQFSTQEHASSLYVRIQTKKKKKLVEQRVTRTPHRFPSRFSRSPREQSSQMFAKRKRNPNRGEASNVGRLYLLKRNQVRIVALNFNQTPVSPLAVIRLWIDISVYRNPVATQYGSGYFIALNWPTTGR